MSNSHTLLSVKSVDIAKNVKIKHNNSKFDTVCTVNYIAKNDVCSRNSFFYILGHS